MTIIVLLAALAALGIAFTLVFVSTAVKRGETRTNPEAIALGAVTNFFDTLGIGSFAPSTAWIKFRHLVPDSFIPAILNVGHSLPTIAQSAIFLVILGVNVDPVLLASCIISAVIGALVGAPLVVRAPVRLVQSIVGVALLIAACLYAMSNLNLMPIGGTATALPAMEMGIAIAVHFLLGALMAFGIGLYAPSLILLSLLGLDPRLAFPIMASACAFLMPTTGFSFMKSKRIDMRLAIGMAIGGIPAVLLAAFVVKEMPIIWLRWGVVVVVLYASVLLLRSAFRSASMNPGLGTVHGYFCALNGLGSLIVFMMGTSSAPANEVVAGLTALSLVLAAVAVAHFYAMNGADSGKLYGRTISRVIGVLWLIGFPIGTILGVYVLIKTGDKHWRSAQSTQAETAIT